MKKYSLVFGLVLAVFMFSQVFADVVTTRRIYKPQQQTQQRKPQSRYNPVNKPASTNKASSDIKNCKPYTETSTYNVDGMNFNFKIKIAGWVNDRCRMDFIADSAGIASNFKDIYGVESSDADIFSFAPKFRCEFTKQQLDAVGDSILEEEHRKAGGKMLRDPNGLDLYVMSKSTAKNDLALFAMLTDGRTCKLINAGDAGKMLDSLLGF